MAAAGCGSGSSRSSDTDTGSDTGTSPDTDADSGKDAGSDTDTASDTGSDTDTGTGDFAVTDRVEFTTTMGTFVVGLYGNDAPITVQNFLTYVDEGFFDGLVFHRVIPSFMIQGGGYDKNLIPKATHPAISLEIVKGLSHQPGVISMARETAPNTATSQFFICVTDDSYLDGDYAAFGDTLSGYDVVKAISKVTTKTVGVFKNVPVEPVIITSAVRL
ncbi:MAG: peptidylprolyl isomerase [Deltaproteobacteria bacterium]|nr:peptidylprolyl isomerase [Deltaproteobacteria bacterium]